MTAMESEYLKYDDTVLDEESLKIIREELKETVENKKKCLDIIKKKLLEIKDLDACLQDNFLLGFLRVSKYDCKNTFQRIMKYYEGKRNNQEIFEDYSPRSVMIVKTARQMYVSPYRMKNDLSAIVILKRGNYDPSKIPYELILRLFSMVCDSVFQEGLNQMCGCTFIIDMKSSSWSSWGEYTPARVKLLTRSIQQAAPMRIRGVHIVNAPAIYYLVFSLFYPFMSTKMKNRLHIHKDNDTLHSFIAPEVLPKEYGGNLEQSDLIDLYDRLKEKEDFFCKFSKYGFLKKKK